MNKKSIPGETLVENFYKLPLFQKIRLFMNEDTEPFANFNESRQKRNVNHATFKNLTL